MSDAVKFMAIGCLTVALCVAIVAAPDEPQVWGAILALLSAILGVPGLIRLIERLKQHD